MGVACSRAFEQLSTYRGRKAVVLNIDEVSERSTDVENVAWTYDADYSYLADGTLDSIVVGGVRRHDQALRLGIAGVDPSRIVTVESETDTANLIELAAFSSSWIQIPSPCSRANNSLVRRTRRDSMTSVNASAGTWSKRWLLDASFLDASFLGGLVAD